MNITRRQRIEKSGTKSAIGLVRDPRQRKKPHQTAAGRPWPGETDSLLDGQPVWHAKFLANAPRLIFHRALNFNNDRRVTRNSPCAWPRSCAGCWLLFRSFPGSDVGGRRPFSRRVRRGRSRDFLFSTGRRDHVSWNDQHFHNEIDAL